MLTIKIFTVNPIQENCYIVSDETNECVIIDCGVFSDNEEEQIEKYLQQENLLPKVQLFTHGHFDHVMGSNRLFQKFHLKAQLHPADTELYQDCEQQLLRFLRLTRQVTMAPFEGCLTEGHEIKFGTHKLQVIHTPGHTPGGVCFYCAEEHILFSGDSLFLHSIGRTDFPGGDFKTLIDGIQHKLFTLPESTIVYPGHGPSTTIKDELESNPYFRMI